MNFYDFFPTLPSLQDASCREYPFPDLFFPDGRADEAKRLPLAQVICSGCPVRKECLDYAITEGIPHGIWAGTTPRMRGWEPIPRSKSGMKRNIASEVRLLASNGRTHQEIAKLVGTEVAYVRKVLIRSEAKLEGENQSQPIVRPSEGSPSSSGFQQ